MRHALRRAVAASATVGACVTIAIIAITGAAPITALPTLVAADAPATSGTAAPPLRGGTTPPTPSSATAPSTASASTDAADNVTRGLGAVPGSSAGQPTAPPGTSAPSSSPNRTTAPKTGPVIWVDTQVNAAWPTAAAVRYVDRFTSSRLTIGRCHAGSRCVVIREDNGLPAAWGAATWPGSPTTLINLNPARRTTDHTERMHILVHELGHAQGIFDHAQACTSIMYGGVRCPNGDYAPLRFTAAQQRILRAH